MMQEILLARIEELVKQTEQLKARLEKAERETRVLAEYTLTQITKE